MRLTLRLKLLLLVATASIALMALVMGGLVISRQQRAGLADVESRLVPRLRLAPELEAKFDRLRQELRDAVSAQDPAQLDSTALLKDQILVSLSQSAPVLGVVEAGQLRVALSDYYMTAESVSRRLIAGETGEALVRDLEGMQRLDKRVAELIAQHAALSQPDLEQGFSAVRATVERADAFRVVMGLSGFLLVLGLSGWLLRGVLRSLGSLSQGFERFATGDLSQALPVLSRDELGDVAMQANVMASRLQQLNAERDAADWIKAGVAGLLSCLRQDLGMAQLAEQALMFLSTRVEAVAGAVYTIDERDAVLRLTSHYASLESSAPNQSFRLGEGLLGQAAQRPGLTLLESLPEDYMPVRSGLGQAKPTSLAFLPLRHLDRPVGVVEFAFFTKCPARARQLLESIAEPLALSLSVAASRAAQTDLLARTQEQAERLTAQEEELRRNNQELRGQQEELTRANEELLTQRSALRAQNAEIEETRQRIQQKVEELAQVSSYKSQFLANMSHELRTPLNSMLLLSSLLSENPNGNLTPKQVEYAKTVHASGKDLLQLINQILDLAKIESGKQEVELEQFDLREVLEQTRRVFEPLAEEKGLQFSIHVAPGLSTQIETDRPRVERILANLIGNAIKFTHEGHVAVSLEPPPAELVLPYAEHSWLALKVDDTGIGIAPEARARVFSPFEQGEARLDRRYGGTGLGLAIARESARLLGGDLRLLDKAGAGSQFICVLPQSATHSSRVGGDVSQSVPPHVEDDRNRLSASDRYLLLIEDDPVVAEQLAELTRARGFKVLIATTGEEGLSLARRHLPYGIILDIKLPDLDGWSIMERLKRDPVTRSIPVHFVSAIEAPAKGLAMGAVGYLVKPVSHSELVEVVRRLTPSTTPGSGRVLIVEDDVHGGESILHVLRSQGIEAEHVTDAAVALSRLRETPFGCLVLDLGLPDMDGLGLLQALSARQDVQFPRVVIHTGRALTRDETRRLEQYATAVILKDGASEERLVDEVRLFLSHIERSQSSTGNAPEPFAADSSLLGARVLLADDDMRTVYAVSALLRSRGAMVSVADSGLEALRLLEEDPDVDIVLMDIMMPQVDGYEAMRRIRSQDRFVDLPIVALTAKAMKGERERCLDAGASDYLPKPLDAERLLFTLKRWLPKGAPRDS
jgi:CheY-like chemotaxis protein/signal transduction histidine kinase